MYSPLLIIISLMSTSTAQATTASGANNDCNSTLCVETASLTTWFTQRLDKAVNPCDDFYRFACGSFINNTVMSQYTLAINYGAYYHGTVLEQMSELLQEPSSPAELRPLRLAKNFYKACTNVDAIKVRSLPGLRAYLKKFGGWPVLEGNKWNEENFNWIETLYKLSQSRYSYDQLLRLGTLQNATGGKPALYVRHPTFLDKTYWYVRYRSWSDHINDAVDTAVVLGADRDFAKEELSRLIPFLEKLSEAYNNSASCATATIGQLTNSFPSIPWKEAFNRLLPPPYQAEDSDLVSVMDPGYIRKVIEMTEETPKRILANLVMWRVVFNAIRYIDSTLQGDLQYDRFNNINNSSHLTLNPTACASFILHPFRLVFETLYVRKYLSEEIKRDTAEMTENIKKNVIQMIQEVDWLDDESRSKVADKATSISVHMVHHKLPDDETMEGYYQSLELRDDNLPEALLNISLFGVSPCQMGLPDDEGMLDQYHPHLKYIPQRNIIEINVPTLQFFWADAIRGYTRYAVLGRNIAYQIIHAVHSEAQKLNKEENRVDSGTPSTAERYHEKAECFINQYGNYSLPGIEAKLDAVQTLDKNIKDNGGLRLAYLAYKNWSAHNEQESMLPGFLYTPRQLFWIIAAVVECDIARPKYRERQMRNPDYPVPAEFRTIGSLSNYVEFSEDFNCPVGSPMNPEKKCRVW